MKLCTCNNCGEIFEDMNPQVGAKEYAPINVEPLVQCYSLNDNKPDVFWGCPNCGTDDYLSDTVDAESMEDLEKGDWILTDADTGQYGLRLSTNRYEFKEDEKKSTIIDLEKYSWLEICDCCEAYYENMDELFRQYGEKSTWIIAECLFESNIIKS